MSNAEYSHWKKPPPSSCPLEKQQATILLDLDVLAYFKNDSKGLLTHVNAASRELAGLTLKKGKQTKGLQGYFSSQVSWRTV